MDMGSTFPNWRGFKLGSEKDSGGGRRMPPARPVTAGPSLRVSAGKAMRPRFLEKCRHTDMPAVPKPTQVGGYKHTKARERNLVKELGNIAP